MSPYQQAYKRRKLVLKIIEKASGPITTRDIADVFRYLRWDNYSFWVPENFRHDVRCLIDQGHLVRAKKRGVSRYVPAYVLSTKEGSNA